MHAVRRVACGTSWTSGRARHPTRVPADHRRDRFVQVHHVVAAAAQLIAQRGTPSPAPARRSRPPRWPARPTVRPERRSTPGSSSRAYRAHAAVQPRPLGGDRRGRTGVEDSRVVASRRRTAAASASTWRVTPPGYVHEYGDTRAIRISADAYLRDTSRRILAVRCRSAATARRLRDSLRAAGMSAGGDAAHPYRDHRLGASAGSYAAGHLLRYSEPDPPRRPASSGCPHRGNWPVPGSRRTTPRSSR